MFVHAASQAALRGLARKDAESALLSAAPPSPPGSGTWRVTGHDEEGNELTVIVAVEERIEIVTLL